MFKRCGEKKYKYERIVKLTVAPNNPNPNFDELMTSLKIEEEQPNTFGKNIVHTPRVDQNIEGRGFTFAKALFDEYGLTFGCVGCAVTLRSAKRNRPLHCRARITNEFNKTEERKRRLKNIEEITRNCLIELKEHAASRPPNIDENTVSPTVVLFCSPKSFPVICANAINLFGPDRLDDDHGDFESSANTENEDNDENKRLLTWVDQTTQNLCNVQEIREMFNKFDKSVDINRERTRNNVTNIPDDINEM